MRTPRYACAVARTANFLGRDPAPRILRWGWVLWTSWLLVGGALLLGDQRAGVLGVGAVLAAPFWLLWLFWLVYRGLRALVRWHAAATWGAAPGATYEFDGRRIRIGASGDSLWFAAADVFDALDTPADARDPERVRQIVGRDGLQPAPDSGVPSFSEKGLAAWLERRSERQAGQFTRWVNLQVVAPHRRRRELEATAD